MAAPGPVLEQARQAGVLKIAMRSYPRPSPPGEPLPPEPDAYDQALAEWLALQLGARVQVAPVQEADIVLQGVSSSPWPDADTQTRSGYADERLQLVALKRQAKRWQAYAPAGWQALLPPQHLPGLLPAIFQKKPRDAPTVCVGTGVASAASLEAWGLQPQIAPSSVHAVSDFLAGKCHLLVDAPAVVERLLAQESWRFYTRLGGSFVPDGKARVQLRSPDARSARWLQQSLQQWQQSGGQQRALDSRVSTIALEVSLLEDGAICH